MPIVKYLSKIRQKSIEEVWMNPKNTSTNTQKYVIPGDIISSTEEYVAGKNTTEIGGNIISAVYGTVYFDENNLTVSVINSKKKISAHVGDVVYGQITKVDRGNATLKISAIYQGDQGLVSFDKESTLRMPRAGGRGEDQMTGLSVGDLVRAKVTRTGRGIEVSIFGRHFGVIKTVCHKCRNPLTLKGDSLYCDNCERAESRKITDDYGAVMEFGDVNERR
ncbi:MAG: exosome complex RNA-binding protein Csl4 [Thermoplasmataceae archaeon]